MSDYEQAVFISYAWKGESEEIVNEIDRSLQERGIKIIRDKRDLGYKGSIGEFMERIGRGNCVIVVISDKYLRSPNCMFELVEIADGKQFHDRVFPVVLNDANIYDTFKRIEYVKYWEVKRNELAEAMKTLDPANLQGIREDMDLYDRIRDRIAGLASMLKDMNTLSPELHQQGDYAILADAIAERMRSINSVQQENIRDRRLDAAMPKECHVGHTTEVRVLIALPGSQGLKAYLPDYTVSRELIDKGDVEGARTPINFPYDPNTNRLLLAYLYVKINAPHFRIVQRVQQLLVPPDKDSGMLTFFLTPNKPQSIGRVSVKLYHDKDCITALGSVTLTTKLDEHGEGLSERSWQLKTLSLSSAASNSESAKPGESPKSAMNVSASNNSVAVADVDIQNVQGSNIHIGNIIYNTPPPGRPPELAETIDTEYFESETILIPKGPFFMGSLNAGDGPAYETPQHTVNLPAYRIGKYPVTNSQYEEFVREKHIPVAPVMGWEGQRVPSGLENHPVSGVTWYEALAYCQWLSEKTGRNYSLPNEAQWEKACRGGNGFLYPWGNDFETGRSNHGSEAIAAVDAFPAQSECGCFDMVGNVRQWTCSLWGEKRSQPDARYLYPWKDDQRNSLGANRQIRRVVRGSSMRDAVTALRCSARSGQLPEDRGLPGLRHGFRVVIHLNER
jgi:formylglycine-generating enzyme required for sulfatase activity